MLSPISNIYLLYTLYLQYKYVWIWVDEYNSGIRFRPESDFTAVRADYTWATRISWQNSDESRLRALYAIKALSCAANPGFPVLPPSPQIGCSAHGTEPDFFFLRLWVDKKWIDKFILNFTQLVTPNSAKHTGSEIDTFFVSNTSTIVLVFTLKKNYNTDNNNKEIKTRWTEERDGIFILFFFSPPPLNTLARNVKHLWTLAF